MTETLWERVRARLCRWFGHREEFSQIGLSVSCRRCRRLLRGPLNLTDRDRRRWNTSPVRSD